MESPSSGMEGPPAQERRLLPAAQREIADQEAPARAFRPWGRGGAAAASPALGMLALGSSHSPLVFRRVQESRTKRREESHGASCVALARRPRSLPELTLAFHWLDRWMHATDAVADRRALTHPHEFHCVVAQRPRTGVAHIATSARGQLSVGEVFPHLTSYPGLARAHTAGRRSKTRAAQGCAGDRVVKGPGTLAGPARYGCGRRETGTRGAESAYSGARTHAEFADGRRRSCADVAPWCSLSRSANARPRGAETFARAARGRSSRTEGGT
jgi:hypothetical protein